MILNDWRTSVNNANSGAQYSPNQLTKMGRPRKNARPQLPKCQHPSGWHRSGICGRPAKYMIDDVPYCGYHNPELKEKISEVQRQKYLERKNQFQRIDKAKESIIVQARAIRDWTKCGSPIDIAIANSHISTLISTVEELIEAEQEMEEINSRAHNKY